MGNNNLVTIGEDGKSLSSPSYSDVLNTLKDNNLSINKLGKEMSSLLEDTKSNDSALALQVRLEAIKFIFELNGIKVDKGNNINLIFNHTPKDNKLNY